MSVQLGAAQWYPCLLVLLTIGIALSACEPDRPLSATASTPQGGFDASPTPVAPKPLVELDGTGGHFIAPQARRDNDAAVRIYLEDDRRFEIYGSDPLVSWQRPLWLSHSTTAPWGRPPTFAFEACAGQVKNGSCSGTRGADHPNIKDRQELAIINHTSSDDREALGFGRTRYLAFSLSFDSVSESPMLWTLIVQAWQPGDGNPPPFAIWLRPSRSAETSSNLPLELVFATRSARTDRNIELCDEGQAAPDCPHVVYSRELDRGKWYRFVVQLRPGFSGDAQVAVWDGRATTQSPNALSREDWGYPPQAGGQAFDLRFGIYRRPQPRALKVFFDDVRYGTTGASVDR